MCFIKDWGLHVGVLVIVGLQLWTLNVTTVGADDANMARVNALNAEDYAKDAKDTASHVSGQIDYVGGDIDGLSKEIAKLQKEIDDLAWEVRSIGP